MNESFFNVGSMDSVGMYPRKNTVFDRITSKQVSRTQMNTNWFSLRNLIVPPKKSPPPTPANWQLEWEGVFIGSNQIAVRSGCDLRYFLVRDILAVTHFVLSPKILPISAQE